MPVLLLKRSHPVVIFSIPLPVIVHFLIFEQGKGHIVREPGDAEPDLAKRSHSVPDIGNHPPGLIQNHCRNIRREIQAVLPGTADEIPGLDKDRDIAGREMVLPDPVGDNAGNIEKLTVEQGGIGDIVGESPFRAVALGLFLLSAHWRIILPICAVARRPGTFGTEYVEHDIVRSHSELTDGLDPAGDELFRTLPAYPEKVADRQRPHLVRDFLSP